jgi:hypothetical protein
MGVLGAMPEKSPKSVSRGFLALMRGLPQQLLLMGALNR